MPLPLLLAGCLVAAIAVATVLASIRARNPYLRAARLGSGTLAVARDDEESGVAGRLAIAVRAGPVRVVGRDCRSLQLLVKVAAQEGLEVVDPDGYVVRASRRLVDAKGVVPDRHRLRLSWTVVVDRPTVAVAGAWSMHATDSGDGRVLSFAPGTSLLLWDGDVLG
jgi:hypothetical protein